MYKLRKREFLPEVVDMPVLPAFCNTCGTIFKSGFFIENSKYVSLSGVTAGPCPACGGTGHIPDGVFSFIGTTVEILRAPERTMIELKALSKVLEKAHKEKISYDQLETEIATETPELLSLLDYLPKNGPELVSYLGLLISILSFLFTVATHEPSNKVDTQQVINHIYQQQIIQNNYNSTLNKSSASSIKVGRNDRCPCGSGLKHKKCCGQ